MLGTPLLVTACVYCKCTNCKCADASKKPRQAVASTQSSGTSEVSIARNPSISEVQHSTELRKRMLVEQMRHSSEEDDSYHIPGHRHIPKKVSRPMAEIPKKKKVVANIHIPKKVFTPMLKIPRSSETGNSRLLKTRSQASSTTLQQKLMDLIRPTKMPESILKKRYKDNRKTVTPAKDAKVLVLEPDEEGLYSYVEIIPLQTGAVENGKDQLDYIDAEGDDPSCCRNEYNMKRGFRHLFHQEKLGNRYGLSPHIKHRSD